MAPSSLCLAVIKWVGQLNADDSCAEAQSYGSPQEMLAGQELNGQGNCCGFLRISGRHL
jgi:hypothetical protein